MRILITGVGGFVGKHLAEYFHQIKPDAELHGTIFRNQTDGLLDYVNYHALDLKDTEHVHEVIRQVRPERIYHLAAYTFVPASYDDPWRTLENNTRAQLNLFEGCRASSIAPRVLITSSATVYGTVAPSEVPLTEESPFRPTDPYSLSKITQEMMGRQYHLTYGWDVVSVRPFNHIGPGQNEHFVAPSFAYQIAEIEQGIREPVIQVGDLSAKRDFTDVRDVVRAYDLLMEYETPHDLYNVASGRSHSIQFILERLLELSTTRNIRVEVDASRLRPAKTPILEGDFTRLKEATGWAPEIPIETTLEDILNDMRRRVQSKE